MKKIILLTSIVIFGSTLFAEIAPKHYKKMQVNASEQLQIKILSVVKQPCGGCEKREVTVKAIVLKAMSSKSRLKAKQVIYIRYIHFVPNKKNWVGPRSIPILQKNQIYPAFLQLNKKSNYYSPAARGATFEPMIH